MTPAEASALAIDRPFAPPLECVMDLPFPPSTNEIWAPRRGKGLRASDVYMRWKHQADMAVIANGTWRDRVRMPNAFTAEILLSRSERRPSHDADNRIKAVLDWAQRVELIANDRLSEDVRARWVNPYDAPHGCRLILRSVTP